LASLSHLRRPRGAGQLGRQLITARVAVELVLGRVDRLGLLDDLARDPLVVQRRVAAGVSRDLRAVDRDEPDPRQPGLRAEPEHRAEQAGQRLLVTLEETGDRRVIRLLLGGDHPVGDVLFTGTLDRARRPHPTRIGVKKQRDHHRRLIGRAPVTVLAIGAIERAEIHRVDGVQDEPREVPLRQPIPHVWRHQERLLAIAHQEVLRHHRMVFNRPDGSSDARLARARQWIVCTHSLSKKRSAR
jgi:hypothetical protein